MELDYITIRRICREISSLAKSSQIREIIAFGDKSAVLVLRNGHEEALLFSADPKNSRLHLLKPIPSRSQNPDTHFHRIVRHHLEGSIVDDFILIEGERIIELKASRKDFSGDIKSYRFIAELMGRHSNLILLDDNNIILSLVYPKHASESNPRDLRVGKSYSFPPQTQRIPLKAYSQDDFLKFLFDAEKEYLWGKLILESFTGVTPGFTRYISEHAQVSDKIPIDELSKELAIQLHKAYLTALDRLRQDRLFPPFDNLLSVNAFDDYPTNRAVAQYYASLLSKEDIEKRETTWKKTVEAKIKSLERLVSNLSRDSEKAHEAEKYKLMGDLIFAFLDRFDGGRREAEVENIFKPETDEKVKIRLLPAKNAIETAQEYHKRAKRMRRGEKEISSHLEETQKQLEKFQAILKPPEWISDASDEKFQKALDDVKGGKTDKIIRKKMETEPKIELPRNLRGENIHHYRSNEGHDIFVGGNDRANEVLFKWGQPDDYWLHVKNMPGSHVLIPRRGEAIEFDTILFAAQIAVFHSQAKGSNKVTVDYTIVKYVNKPSGATPGFVTYKKEKSVRVDSPDEKSLEKHKIR